MWTSVSFNASFDHDRTLYWDLLPKVVKKIGLPNICRLFQIVLSHCTKNKIKLGFVKTTGMPGEDVESFSRYAGSWICVLAKVLFRCVTIFPIVCALCDSLLRLSPPGNCLECVSRNNLQHILSLHLTSALRKISYSCVF